MRCHTFWQGVPEVEERQQPRAELRAGPRRHCRVAAGPSGEELAPNGNPRASSGKEK
uniref:Uncharacterized protein n=1 Tax=Arundo donax TaxID=35708 RepID=A0A0A9H1H4_ARUDO